MLVSELVSLLQKEIDQHGDLEVLLDDEEMGWCVPERLAFCRWERTGQSVTVIEHSGFHVDEQHLS